MVALSVWRLLCSTLPFVQLTRNKVTHRIGYGQLTIALVPPACVRATIMAASEAILDDLYNKVQSGEATYSDDVFTKKKKKKDKKEKKEKKHKKHKREERDDAKSEWRRHKEVKASESSKR